MRDTKKSLFLIFFDKILLGVLATAFLLAGEFYVSREIAEDFRRLEKIEDLHVAIDDCDHSIFEALNSSGQETGERQKQLRKIADAGRNCHGALLKAGLYMRDQSEHFRTAKELCHEFSERLTEVHRGHQKIAAIADQWPRLKRKIFKVLASLHDEADVPRPYWILAPPRNRHGREEERRTHDEDDERAGRPVWVPKTSSRAMVPSVAGRNTALQRIQGDGAFGGGKKHSAAAAKTLRRHRVGKAVFESPTTMRIDRGRR